MELRAPATPVDVDANPDPLEAVLAAAFGAAPTPATPVGEVAGDRTLGDYRIVREIGRGGMGIVYEAEQISLGRRVALKVLPFAATLDPRQLQRFKNEAQAAAQLHHTHIVPVFGVGCERSTHFYAMQFIDGQSLATLIHQLQARPGGQPVAEAASMENAAAPTRAALTTDHASNPAAFFRTIANWGIQAAEALEYAHQMGVVHRDIKPANLIVDVRGNLWITDFGLARMDGAQGQTMTGDLLGTLRYMSPEQAESKPGVVDQRTDVYALGATLYELLTLRPVHSGADRAQLLQQIAREDPRRPRAINPAIPGDLETIVLKALAKEAAGRYATAQEFADDLRRFLGDEPIKARRPTLVQRMRKWSRRHRPVVLTATLGLLLLVAGLGGGVGWAVRDRSVQQAALDQEIESALRDATRWQKQSKYAEALSAALRAEGLLAMGGSDALRESVRQSRKDFAMVLQCEEIRARKAIAGVEGGFFEFSATDREYAKAFREYGIDVEHATIEEAAEFIRDCGIALELSVALDDWAHVRWGMRKFAVSDWRQLVAIAGGVDPDPWRNRLREAVKRSDAEGLVQLAAADNLGDLPPATLCYLASLLHVSGAGVERAEKVMRRAQRLHPNDFWVNFQLAFYADLRRQWDDSILYYTVARAMRPDSAVVHANLANGQARRGKLDDAIANYHEAIRLKADFHDAYAGLGSALRQEGRMDEALDACRMALQIKPDSPHAHNSLGSVLLKKGRLDQAIAAYRDAIDNNPQFAEAHSNLGIALRQKGMRAEAIAAYSKAIELKPDLAMAHNNLGNVLHGDEAIAAFRKALEFEPDNASFYNNLGNALRDQGKLADAIAAYRRAILLKSDLAQSHGNLGVALRLQGRLEDAVASFLEAIRLDADLAEAHVGLGNVLQDQQKFADAVAAYRVAVAKKPDYAAAHYNLGYALSRQGLANDAGVAFRTAVRLQPGNAKYQGSLGKSLIEQGKYDEAIGVLRKAIDLDPKLAPAHSDLGFVLSKKEDSLDDAIAAYRKALDLNPKSYLVHHHLGNALERKGQRDEAIAAFHKAIELKPDFAAAHSTLGNLLARKGLLDEAIRSYREAVRLNPKDGVVRSNLGVMLVRKGQLEEAIECFRDAVKTNPNYPQGHANLTQALNDLAWRLATDANPKQRNPQRALALAKEAVELAPDKGHFWNTLAVSRLRNGDCQAALPDFEKSMELRKGGDSFNWFFLAMTHWQRGDTKQARMWYGRAVEWMETNDAKLKQFPARYEELRRFRAEAALLMELPPPK